MTSREKVLNVYQGMKTERNLPGGWVALVYTRNPKGDEPLVRVLGRGDTEDAAIDDAASKLPPGSPAGETASACKHERSYSYSEVGEAGYVNKSGTRKCVDCGEEFNPRAVPEPVPTEGAASHKICEATFWMAEERFTCAKFRGHAGLHESLSGTRDIGRTGRYDSSAPEAAAAPLTYDDCTKSEADAAEQWAVAYVCKVGVSKETMIDAISTLRAQVMAYERLSAAPIAPAAEELIQELVDALWEAAQSLRTIADGAGRREFMEHMDQVRGYANSRANVAHELAEEYRKGAKNA